MLASKVGTGDALGGADERLRAQVDDGVHLPHADRALDRRRILERAVDQLDAIDVAAAHELGLRIAIDDQRDDGGTAGEQRLHRPRADDARGAGDEHAPPGPGRRRAHRVLRR